MKAPNLNLFNIPIARPFFGTLVKELLAGKIIPAINPNSDPLALADLTIFVPTRRAARALRQVLSAALAPSPVILPRIIPLGDVDDLDERSLLGDKALNAASLPPEINPLSRQLYLMGLIEKWRIAIRSSLMVQTSSGHSILQPHDLFQVAASPLDAFGLAGDLALLLDEMIIEEIDWDKLKDLAPNYDEYWSITLQFLEIAATAWPQYLQDNNLMDQVQRRHALLQLEAQRLEYEKPSQPIIVAGSTGSQLATAQLMTAIAKLKNGAVILPGLDQHLSDEDWHKIPIQGADIALGLTSPQAALKRLLELRMKASRQDVVDLGHDDRIWTQPRRALIAEILRPAETTDQWVNKSTDNSQALSGLTLIETSDEREEALAIALKLRHALSDLKCKAALVTPDRALAARVSAELARFGIKVEDSAGRQLSATPRGVLAKLVLDVAVSDFAPASVLALLYHPLVTFGHNRQELEPFIAAFDICVLRQPISGTSIAALKEGIHEAQKKQRLSRPGRRLNKELIQLNETVIALLEAALLPLMQALETGVNLSVISKAHEAALAALTLDSDLLCHHLDEVEGQTLASLFETLYAETSVHNNISETYAVIFDSLARAQPVRQNTNAHPRLHIWGQLEARLLDVDLVILGGLNEGSWPPTAHTDAFLNRPMRASIGLSPPERRIGQSAHDFSMLMGMKQVVLTRSARAQDQPTIASRFLRRLEAYSGKADYEALRKKGDYYVNIARHLDDMPAGEQAKPAIRPEPKPPVNLRPTRLSVTEIETLYRDPYAIFAKHVLRLEALNERFSEPDAAMRGSLVHDAIAEFTELYPDSLPDEALAKLLAIGGQHFAPLMHHLDVATFWWPRFENTAQWFIEEYERERRKHNYLSVVELAGVLEFTLSDGSPFTLKGRADRIDLYKNGCFAVVDYKTGTPPSSKEVLAGFNPQLTLEAAMVRAGAFKDIAALPHNRTYSASELSYVKLLGSARSPGKITIIDPKNKSYDELANEHFDALKLYLMRYRDANKGYISRRAPKKTSYQSPYDHLARVKEWADTDDGDDS